MRLLPLFVCMLLFNACAAQQQESYWKAAEIVKADGEAFRGITESYMEMLIDMQLHIQLKGDSLIVDYPYQRSLEISTFKSLTNARIEHTGALLDSVEEVEVTTESLKIWFRYLGTSEKDNRFCLHMLPQNRESYLQELEQLKKESSASAAAFGAVDLSPLKLNALQAPEIDPRTLAKINPMQMAQELTGDEQSTKAIDRTFTFTKGALKQEYSNIGLENSAIPTARLQGVDFHTTEYISDAKNKTLQAVIVVEKNVEQSALLKLYDELLAKNKDAQVAQFGLPKFYEDGTALGIHSFMAITLKSGSQTIKFAIDDVPEELYIAEVDQNIAVPAEGGTADEIKKIFRHYLGLIDRTNLNIFIVSNEFDQLLHAKENNSESLTSGNINNYVFKWTRLTDIWDSQE